MDSTKTREYIVRTGLVGYQAQTYCGEWLSICEDDPEYDGSVWAEDEQSVTCPACIACCPTEWPGYLLIVRGPLGIPQVVKVEDGEWVGVFGFAKGKVVNPDNKEVLYVLQEGDVLEDIGYVVQGGELVKVEEPKEPI